VPLTSSRSGLSGRTARLLKSGWRRGGCGGGCFFPPEESAPPADLAASIVRGTGYDLSRQPAPAYFGDLIQPMLGHTPGSALQAPGTGRARSSAIRDWLRNGVAGRPASQSARG